MGILTLALWKTYKVIAVGVIAGASGGAALPVAIAFALAPDPIDAVAALPILP